jgi:hypothetical protein
VDGEFEGGRWIAAGWWRLVVGCGWWGISALWVDGCGRVVAGVVGGSVAADVSGWLRVVAVVAGGQHEVLTVFRRYLGHRCGAPEKIRIDRSAGNNSGVIGEGWLAEVRS